MSIPGLSIGFLMLITCVLLFVQFGLRFVITYKIKSRAIEVFVFQFILLKRIPFDNIAEIETVSFRDMLFRFVTIRPPFTTRLGNRAFGEGVLITQKSGVIRRCIISPDHPDEFIRSVTADIAKDRS